MLTQCLQTRHGPTGHSESPFTPLSSVKAMTQERYRDILVQYDPARASCMTLGTEVDGYVALTVLHGLNGTGDSMFTAPASPAGMPSVSLPARQDVGSPLALQIIECTNEDPAVFTAAGAALDLS